MKRFSVLMFALAIATSAEAVPQLKFDDPITPGGTIAYNGTLGTPITGTAIQFQSIQGIDTPLNAGVTLTCVGCLLTFTTGGVTSEGPTVWTASGGGSLSITGAVPGVGLGAGSTLATGSFSGTNPTVIASGTSGTFTAGGLDIKNTTLTNFFGLGANFSFLSTEIALGTTTIGANGSFTATATNSDFNNTSAAVPTPSTLLLLLSGVPGLVALRPWKRIA